MNSAAWYNVIIAGMPGGRQSAPGFQLPWPPLAWSARLASSTAWYSGVSGACWPRPHGLVGSNAGWPPTPGIRTPIHWPHRSGYFASSKAWAAEQVATRASPIAPNAFRYSMVFPLVIDSIVGLAPADATRHVEAALLACADDTAI